MFIKLPYIKFFPNLMNTYDIIFIFPIFKYLFYNIKFLNKYVISKFKSLTNYHENIPDTISEFLCVFYMNL